MVEDIKKAAEVVKKHIDIIPEVAIILGTGLSDVAEGIQNPIELPYKDIPGFGESNLIGHAGRFIVGTFGGKNVIAMDGRYHYYEGFTLNEVVLPIRVMQALGAKTLIVSNAAGGLNPMHKTGDIIILDDHIGLFGPNVLIGPNDENLGPRFCDMSAPYTPELIDMAEAIALKRGVRASRGVYVWVTGPTLETRAEYRMLRAAGADVVGMSTVPEVTAAVHLGMKVLGFSVITDRCLPDALVPAKIEDIIAVANASGAKLAGIINDVVEAL